jgi:hypothetical protein
MIAITRRTLRRFRAACARCVAGRIRGPSPPVVIRQGKGRVALTATFPEVTLELGCGTSATSSEVLVVPMAVLDELGAVTADLVELEAAGTVKGTARWEEGGKPKTRPLDLILAGKQHDALPRPQGLKTVPPRFLEALHEAGRTSSREDGRYALSRVQVRGGKGQVIATDGKVAVVFGNFPFAFTEDVLVPAIPLFGYPEVRDEENVRVGCNARHLVVQAGDWSTWLAVAPSGKFPDVAAVAPKHAPTTVELDRGDAVKLLPQLPQLPGQGHENRPVTLRADGALSVSGYDETTGYTKEISLPGSSVTGPLANVVLDRRALARMLALGCTALRFTPGKAVVGSGEGVTVLVAPLDPQLAAPNADGPKPVTEQPHPDNSVPQLERSTMKPDANGTHNGRRDPPQEEGIDPLAAAEELRQALGETLTKATRLVSALKGMRKEKKVLSAVLSGLKQLNLDGDQR